MKDRGFTLLEMMVVVAVMSMVMGILFLIGTSVHAAYRVQDSKVTTQDTTRNAMMVIVRELRQASTASITAAAWPATQISYQKAVDLDGNGWPVDVNGQIELSAVHTIALDVNDVNGDGETTDQLVLTEAGSNSVRVLASDLVPGAGVLFERVGGALRVTLWATMETASDGAPRMLVSALTETVAPRN